MRKTYAYKTENNAIKVFNSDKDEYPIIVYKDNHLKYNHLEMIGKYAKELIRAIIGKEGLQDESIESAEIVAMSYRIVDGERRPIREGVENLCEALRLWNLYSMKLHDCGVDIEIE